MASLSHHSAGSGSGFPWSARATHGPSCRSVTNIHSSIVPVQEDLLRALLNADLVGFHTFDYARHFMSSCSLLFGVSSHACRGHICIDYHGRNVLVSILPVGVDMGQLRAALATPGAAAKAKEIAEAYRGQTVDADLFKGVDLKLLALVKLFDTEPGMRGKVVLVQINNPVRLRRRRRRRPRREGGDPAAHQRVLHRDRLRAGGHGRWSGAHV
ncbi:hypothetical protein ACP70R_045245 [Stipagrostis hirtigluma subsp. patula]